MYISSRAISASVRRISGVALGCFVFSTEENGITTAKRASTAIMIETDTARLDVEGSIKYLS
jgi:hypothetical protein